MKIAVAGPTGVLGRNLISELINKGHHVLALSRSEQKAELLLPEEVEIIKCDLLDNEIVDQLSGLLENYDAVIHIATSIPDDFTAPGAWDTNTRLRTEGTRRLLDASLKAGVKKYLQQSIVMAYPDKGENWITEECPLDDSGQRKTTCEPVIEMETMIREISKNELEWNILRGGIFTGRDTFQDRLIDQMRNNSTSLLCEGDYYASYIHVKDMADAFVRVLEHPVAGETFNICDEPILQKDYIRQLADHLGINLHISSEKGTCPPSHRCSNEKAKKVLSWKPRHGYLPDGEQIGY